MELISAIAAKEKGHKFYFTGKPCKNGSISPRWVSDRHCSCDKCSSSKYQRDFETKRATQIQNIDAYRERHRNFRQANPGKNLSRLAKRRAIKRQAVPGWFGEFDEFALNQAYELTAIRADETGIDWQVDHLIPLQAKEACGLHCASNIQVIPAAINASKRNKFIFTEPNEWIRNSNSAT